MMHPIDTLGRPIGIAWALGLTTWLCWRFLVRFVTDYRQVRARRRKVAQIHAASVARITNADRQRAMRLHPTNHDHDHR